MSYRADGKTLTEPGFLDDSIIRTRLCRSYVDPIDGVVLVLEAGSPHPVPGAIHPRVFSKPSRIVLVIAVASGVWPLSSTLIRLHDGHLRLTPV